MGALCSWTHMQPEAHGSPMHPRCPEGFGGLQAWKQRSSDWSTVVVGALPCELQSSALGVTLLHRSPPFRYTPTWCDRTGLGWC